MSAIKKGYGCFSALMQILLEITFYYFIIFIVDMAWHLARCMAHVAMQWRLLSFSVLAVASAQCTSIRCVGYLCFHLIKLSCIKFKVLVVPNGFMTRRVCIIWGNFFNVFLSDPWERCSLVSMVSGDSFVIMTMQIGQD